MLKVLSPFDNSLIKEIPLDNAQKIENALAQAYRLFHNRSKWIPPYIRIEILDKTAKLMSSRIDELTILAAKEGGKPYKDSKVEVLRAINGVKIAMESIAQLKGEQIPMGLTEASQNRMAFTTREPIGVVVSISAFNHPLNLIIHQTVTAIAAGCPVIIKPASTTPLSCLNFVDILKEAGLPDGWCQPIVCKSKLAQKLATDPRVNYLSFIGSSKIGWYLRSQLSPGTRCALEHGGVAPVIVEKDADLSKMIPALVKGGFYHAGQVCVSVQKIFVNESIIDRLTSDMIKAIKKLKIGNQLDKETDIGPLISPLEVDRVEQWVNEAVDAGAKLLVGGKRISDTCFEPTILLNPDTNSKVSTEEIFGPVVCIYTYKTRKSAIDLANSLSVHFQASVFTKNLDIAFKTVQKLNASAVMINDHTAFRVDWMPFQGRDTSGIGTGGIQYSMHEMTRDKLIVLKLESS